MDKFVSALFALVLAGCATVPDVTLTYYPAIWESMINVTQTVACNEKKDRLIVLSTPSVTTKYFSDLGNARSIRIQDLSGSFTDSEITMTFADDGRLKGVNQSSTGQGEAVIKAAISLGAAVIAIAAKDIRPPAPKPPPCDAIERWSGDKPVTLTYKKSVGPNQIGTTVTLDIAPESADLYAEIGTALPLPESTISNLNKFQSGGRLSPKAQTSLDSAVWLELQEMGTIKIATFALKKPIGDATVVIPLTETYKLPIPKPVLFGKQTFAIGLTDAGVVSTVSYGKIDGSASALNSLSALASARTTGETAKAAELQARADLIAQQQRVVLCESKPDQCK